MAYAESLGNGVPGSESERTPRGRERIGGGRQEAAAGSAAIVAFRSDAVPDRDQISPWYALRGPWLWIVPLAFFIAVAFLEATHGWIGYQLADQPAIGLTLRGQPLAWTDLLARTLPSWMVIGLIAPLVILAARRFPLAAPHWRRNLGLHLVGAVGFAILFVIAAATLRYRLFLHTETDVNWAGTVLRYYTVYFNTFFLNYWALVAVHSALAHHQRNQEVLRLEAQLTEARLAALQAQVRPHFLFNALNAISTLARTGDARRVVSMLAALSEFLRASFRDPDVQLIPLRAEVALLECYLELEKLRFPDRLTVRISADEAAMSAAVPRLLLQPIVENALHHGIAVSSRPGEVEITISREDERIRIDVRDTGPGTVGAVSVGTGLRNTSRRLDELFGDTASLALINDPDGGARATLLLPFVSADAGVAS
jgi:signal transduction histidine kinase